MRNEVDDTMRKSIRPKRAIAIVANKYILRRWKVLISVCGYLPMGRGRQKEGSVVAHCSTRICNVTFLKFIRRYLEAGYCELLCK